LVFAGMMYLGTKVLLGGIVVMWPCIEKSRCCNLSPLTYLLVLASFPYYIRQRDAFQRLWSQMRYI
jgi:hypothetical protein